MNNCSASSGDCSAGSGSNSFITTTVGGASSSFAGSTAGGGWSSVSKSRSISDLAPFSIRPENPGFSTKNQRFQLERLARNPVFGTGARCQFMLGRSWSSAPTSEPGSPLIVALGILVLVTLLASAFGFDKPDVPVDASFQSPQGDSQMVH